jgi:DNA polymerase-4
MPIADGNGIGAHFVSENKQTNAGPLGDPSGACPDSSAPPPRIIAHVDLDAFFASAEQVLNPKLAGKPVIVGGYHTDRSVVASASYQARELGVHVAMPLFRAYRICPQAHFLRGNYHEYARFSKQVFEICRRFSPLVEAAGIDENYLDLTGTARAHLRQSTGRQHTGRGDEYPNWPIRVGELLRDAVKHETGLNISVGLAANKLIAKISSDFAKPNGLVYVMPGYEQAFLAPLALKVVPGIGRRTAEALGEYNLKTVADLRRIPLEQLVKTFGRAAGRALYRKARGRGSDTIDLPDEPKSISRETTFEQDTTDRNFIRAMLYYLTERACWKLRRLGMSAHTITVKLRYSDFKTDARGKSLGHYSDQDHEFYAAAAALLDKLYTRRITARLVGVQLSNLTSDRQHQMHLWDELLYEKRTRFYAAADRIRERYGFGSAITGRAIELISTPQKDKNGFKLRTPCLSQ